MEFVRQVTQWDEGCVDKAQETMAWHANRTPVLSIKLSCVADECYLLKHYLYT